jgi:acid phosphatase
VSDDCDPGGNCQGMGASLVSELDGVGTSWGAYMEDAPGVGYTGGDTGGYAVRHNPFVYFPNIVTGAGPAKIRPLSSLVTDLKASTAPKFVWVTPNLTNDMHDGSVADGDAWLAQEIPTIQATAWYAQGGQIIVEWDEGDGSTSNCCGGNGQGGHIPGLVISAHTHGLGADGTPVDTAGILASIEHSYGVAAIGDAADASNGSLGGFLQ